MKQEIASNIIGPDPRDIAEVNSGQGGWEKRIASTISPKRFKFGVPLGVTGAALFGGHVVNALDNGVKSTGIHIDIGSLASSSFGPAIVEAGDPPVNPSHTPSPDDQPQPPPSPTPHPTEPTPTPTRTPEPTPTRTPEPTPTRTPEPTPTATPPPPTPELRGALKVMKVHDKDAGGDVDFGEEGLPWGFSVDGPGTGDFRMQTNAAKTPEAGAVVAAVAPGQYTVCEDEGPGWFETTAQRCKTVIVSALQVAHVPFFNKQIEAPPPPPPQPPVEKKFVPTPEIPKVCVLPDGREVPLPAEFQAKLFGKDAQTIARMLGEFKCEFLGHDAKQTQQHEEIKQQIKEHDDKMDVQHTKQDEAHDAISDRLEDVWNKIKGLGRGFWDWVDTLGIYVGPAALAALVIWRTRRRDQQLPAAPAQPEGGPQPPPQPQRRRLFGIVPIPFTRRPEAPVVPQPQEPALEEAPAAPERLEEPLVALQPEQQAIEQENVNALASVWLELVGALTDEQLQAVANKLAPEQLNNLGVVLHRMGVANALELAPLAVVRVTRDTINRLPQDRREAIMQRAQEIAQERAQAQEQPALVPEPLAVAPAPEPPAVPAAGEEPEQMRELRARRRLTFAIGGTRRYVQVGSTFTNARGVTYRVEDYTDDGRSFTLRKAGQEQTVSYSRKQLERLMTEHFQRGQGPAQAGQTAAGV